MTDLTYFDGERLKTIRQHSNALHTVARYSDDAGTIAALVDRIIIIRFRAELYSQEK